MGISDFRIGNLSLSPQAFGYNSNFFELLQASITETGLIFTINQYPRNLIKAKIQGEDIINTADPENPATETEVIFDLSIPNILNGAEGIVIIENNATTKLKFEPSIPISQDSNISIRQSGTTVLSFIYDNDNLFHWQSDYKPISINLNSTIELEIDNSQDPIPGKRFKSQKACVKYILENAQLQIYDSMFALDSGGYSVTVYVHYGTGKYEEAFYVPRAGNIGIKFIGLLSDTGQKPVFDATNVINQFTRCVNIYESKNIFLENLHFKRDDMKSGRALVLGTRDSFLTLYNCSIENGSPTNPATIIQAANTRVDLVGNIEIISFSGFEDTFFRSDGHFSSINAKNNLPTSTGIANGGLSILTNQPINFETIFKATRFASIVVDDYLDGSDDGVERYVQGSVTYNTLKTIDTYGELTNQSLKFPG